MTDFNLLARRFIALILDSVILVIIFLSLMMFLGVIGILTGMCPILVIVFAGIVSLIFTVFIAFIYFILLEGPAGGGQTIGKRVVGIKVIGEEGRVPDYGKSFMRNILRIVDVLPVLYLVGAILILLTEKDQRLGDMAAKTMVARV